MGIWVVIGSFEFESVSVPEAYAEWLMRYEISKLKLTRLVISEEQMQIELYGLTNKAKQKYTK